jgi:hypothetical protein
MLRRLVPFFESCCVTNQDSLVRWAQAADFRRDFQGRVKGLGYAAFQWLTMRCGVATVKPDVHTRRFTERCLSRALTNTDIVELVTRAARQLEMPVRSLDLAHLGARERPARTGQPPRQLVRPPGITGLERGSTQSTRAGLGALLTWSLSVARRKS